MSSAGKIGQETRETLTTQFHYRTRYASDMLHPHSVPVAHLYASVRCRVMTLRYRKAARKAIEVDSLVNSRRPELCVLLFRLMK